MAKKTVTELKNYFKAGKRPTESQFNDFIDSYLHLDNPEMFPSNYKYKDFNIRFLNQQANMAVDILLGNNRVHGNIDIQIVGSYNNENTVGVIRKQVIMGANVDNSIWNPPLTRIIEASGLIVNHIYLGDIVWDPALAQYKFTVYHTRSTGNTYSLRVIQHGNSSVSLEKATVSDPYVNQLIGQNKHFVNYNDNVGVGTSQPEVMLHVKAPKKLGNTNAVTSLFDRTEAAGGSNIVQVRYHTTADLELNSGYTGTSFRYGTYSDFNIVNNSNGAGLNFVTNEAVRLSVQSNGNVGIGTQNPDQKLTVKGKIHAEDVIVDTNVPADYVFQKYFDGQSSIKPDYQMPTINELESFVRENKHLPDIPSAKKMSQDGVNLGDLQMKLLQKIEELTLYVISQNKEIETLKAIIKK